MAKSLIERLEQVMADKEWDHAKLVSVSGESSSVVSQWLGKTSRPTKSIGRIGTAQKIAEASGYSALWIAKGEGPERPPTVDPMKLAEAMALIGGAMASLPESTRKELGDELKMWAEYGGKEKHMQAALSTIQSPGAGSEKDQAAA